MERLKKISFVLPVYNEADSLLQLEIELNKLFATLDYRVECIFVNDGSQDNSWLIIKEMVLRNKNFKAINFSRNFGQQSALSAGLIESNGDALVMLDSDLQHPFEIIPLLIAKWEEGYEVVNTRRDISENESFFKKMSSKLFYRVFNLMSEVQLIDGSADFRLLDAKVVKVLHNLSEVDRFYRALVPWVGFKSTFVNYRANNRKYGRSNYTLTKMLALAISGLSSFSTRPLKLIFVFGVCLFFLSFSGMSMVVFYKYILGSTTFTGTAILIFVILISNALQFMAIGILGYFIYGINKEVKQRPSFIVQEKIDSIVESSLVNIKRVD